jgi:hypothetical protein
MEPTSVPHPSEPRPDGTDDQILAVLVDELIFHGLVHP